MKPSVILITSISGIPFELSVIAKDFEESPEPEVEPETEPEPLENPRNLVIYQYLAPISYISVSQYLVKYQYWAQVAYI